jgi:ADP-heptose:LPS heptosyltransferase
MDSIALSLAQNLIKIRQLALPPRSLREHVYTRFLRPHLANLLCRRDAHRVQRVEPQVLSTGPRASLRRSDIREILIVKSDHIGDFLLSLPAASIIRQSFPNARITLLCSSWINDLALKSELFDRVVCADIFAEVAAEPSPRFDPKVLAAYGFPVFDIAIDLRIDPESRFLLGHVSARLKAGFECGPAKQPLMDFAFRAPALNFNGRPNFARRIQLLLAAFAHGIVSLFDAERAAQDAVRPYIRNPARRLTRSGEGPLVGINTRSGLPTKDWPLENYISMIRRLIAESDATIVLLGGKRQQADVDAIVQKIAAASKNIVNLIGILPLSELPAVVDQLDLYVGPDTGTTHLAAMLGRKTLCLHAGVAPLESFGPVGPGVVVVKTIDLPCSPCSLSDLASCAHSHQCMQSITVEIVMAEIEKMLAVPAAEPLDRPTQMNGALNHGFDCRCHHAEVN